MKTIIEKTERFIKKHNMIRPGEVVTAGVSGGADSVCLLFVLCALRERLGFQVAVCHVNHEIRGDMALEDEQYVEALCRRLDVPCHTFRKNVVLIAEKRKHSLEETGREVRRESFEEVCRLEGAGRIATAHHRDDNAETILMNIARGTGLKGLCGIRPVCGKWIRPLLELSRPEIEGALLSEGIRWRTDLTNEDDDYTRNRIRHHIMPMLSRQVNPGTVSHLNALAEQAAEVWDYMESQTDQAWRRDVEEEAGGLLLREETVREAPAVRGMLIRRALCAVAGRERDIQAVHVKQMEVLFSRQTGRSVHLPYGMKASRVYEGVKLTGENQEDAGNPSDPRNHASTADTANPEIRLRIPGCTRIPWSGQVITCRILEGIDVDSVKEIPQKSYTKCFDYDIIKRSLSARTRRAGDYLTTGRKGERQKLKAYFINEKVPRSRRDRILLIAHDSHILWIPGMRMSRSFQVGESTKRILEIKITEEKKDVRDDQSFDTGRGS